VTKQRSSVTPEEVKGAADAAIAAAVGASATAHEPPATGSELAEQAVGLIKGVPFVTQSGDFGVLVEEWLSSSNKASSPKTRLQNAKHLQQTRSADPARPDRGSTTRRQTNGPRTTSADGSSLTNTKVSKARQKVRRAVDRMHYAPPQPAYTRQTAAPHRR
jgi:hypothetical protein